jgi:hypothetical protein
MEKISEVGTLLEKHVHQIWLAKLQWYRPLGRRGVDGIIQVGLVLKWISGETRVSFGGVDWIQLADSRFQRPAVLHIVTNFRIPFLHMLGKYTNM